MMVVQVRVTDVNVHTPFFNNMVTTLNIPEDVAVGSTLLELKVNLYLFIPFISNKGELESLLL